ncbi:MAG: hypothetical protein QNJ72_34935 [Pleurocapsa sp. MO_226.B13]|nr:hypothetical protein [Pleurocapsa sp. MO_226.B13]
MVDTINNSTTISKSTTVAEKRKHKHLKVIDLTYRSNTDSDYTENIELLDRNFKYSDNSNHYWSQPEHSLLYGTPVYEAASPSQKIALNHLHWFTKYNYTAETETETIAFNQITSSVFKAIGGYDTVCQELDLETEQEYSHVHAFRKMGLMIATALIGRKPLQNLQKSHSYKSNLGHNSWVTSQYYALRFLAKNMLKSKKAYYSSYLKQLEEQEKFVVTTPTKGILGRGISTSYQGFFTFNWGAGSPFLACQYYAARMMGNILLKGMEYPLVKYYRKLEKQGEFIPAPTAVSYYHHLDEAYHTTMSRVLSKDMYKDFSQPTAYEKFIANMSIYMVQQASFSGLSGVFPHRYLKDDRFLMTFTYELLQSPLFGMSQPEALHWMQQCFCSEHEGFYLAMKNHQHLLTAFRNFFDDFDYLWSVNRDMKLMESGGDISKAIQNNIKTFKQFSRLAVS